MEATLVNQAYIVSNSWMLLKVCHSNPELHTWRAV